MGWRYNTARQHIGQQHTNKAEVFNSFFCSIFTKEDSRINQTKQHTFFAKK